MHGENLKLIQMLLHGICHQSFLYTYSKPHFYFIPQSATILWCAALYATC